MTNKTSLIYGMGYVGLSIGLLLSKHNKVLFIDTDKEKVDSIKNLDNKNFFDFKKNNLNQKDFINKDNIRAYEDASEIQIDQIDFCIIAIPTNFDLKKNTFETSNIKKIIKYIFSKNDKSCFNISVINF